MRRLRGSTSAPTRRNSRDGGREGRSVLQVAFGLGHAISCRSAMHATRGRIRFHESRRLRTIPPAAARSRPWPTRRPADEGVVIKVEATGLCRSDWHGWMGHDPDIVLPHVPGHELAGTVEAVGSAGLAMARRRPGHRARSSAGCGHCDECHSGNHQVCEQQFQPGFHRLGLVCRIRRHRLRRHQPRGAAGQISTSPPPQASAAASSRRSAPSSTRAASGRANGWRCMAAAASASRPS